MRKIFIFILILCLACSSLFVIACDNTTQTEVETTPDEVVIPNSGSDSTEQSDTLTKEQYITAFDGLINTFTKKEETEQPSNFSLSSMALTISNEDLVLVPDNNRADVISPTFALVYFLRNVLKNNNYELKDTFDDCLMGSYEARILFNYDIETNTIFAVCAARSPVNIPTGLTYLTMYFTYKIMFDFENDLLKEFYFAGCNDWGDGKTAENVTYYQYKDVILKKINVESNNYNSFCNLIVENYTEFMKPEKEIEIEDYAEEYIAAMTEIQSRKFK